MIKNSIKLALTTLMFATVCSAETSYGTVNGEAITQTEITQIMGPQGIQFDTLDKKTKDKILKMIVDRKLLSQSVAKSDIQKSDAYKAKLEILKKELALNVWMEQEAKKIESSVKESDLKAYYDSNSDKFKIPMQLKARHILVEEKDLKSAKEIIKTLSEAKDVKAKFIELAKEKSTGPSGKSGGDLGWFGLKRMVPEFSAAADKLKKGEFTKEPVKTQFGYHVIYLEDRKSATTKSFDKVKNQIKMVLNRKKFNELVESTVKKLKKDADTKLKQLKSTKMKTENSKQK